MTTTLVVLSVIDIVLLIAGLAVYLWIVGSQLGRVGEKLESSAALVRTIERNAEPVEAGLEHINGTAGVVAGALPLLYGMAEGIVTGATFEPPPPESERPPARPAMGTRRTRMLDGVGYRPEAPA